MPKYCHIIEKIQSGIDIETDLRNLEPVETLYEDSHDSRSIVRCPVCGEYLLHDFHEHIDWSHGKDEIFMTYVFAKSQEHAKRLSDLDTHIRYLAPAIHWDCGKEPVLLEKKEKKPEPSSADWNHGGYCTLEQLIDRDNSSSKFREVCTPVESSETNRSSSIIFWILIAIALVAVFVVQLKGANRAVVHRKFPLLARAKLHELKLSQDGKKVAVKYLRWDSNTNVTLLTAVQINNFIDKGFDGDCLWLYSGVSFSKNGKCFGYNFKRSGKWYVQINSDTFGPYDFASGPLFTSSGSRYAFRYRMGKSWHVRIGKRKFGPYAAVTLYQGETENRFLFSYLKKSGSYVYHKGKSLGPYKSVINLYQSRDGKKLGYSFWEEKKPQYVYFAGNTFGPYAQLGTIQFSEAGFCLRYWENGKCYIVLNGKTILSFPLPFGKSPFTRITPGPDGKQVATVSQSTNNGPYCLWLNRKQVARHTWIGAVQFFPNGADLAYGYTQDGFQYTRIGKKVFKEGRSSTIAFSKDGSTFGYSIRINNTNYAVRINDTLYTGIQEIPWVDEGTAASPRISPDGKKFGFVFYKYSGGMEKQVFVRINSTVYGPYKQAVFGFTSHQRTLLAYIKNGYVHIQELSIH